MSSQSGPPSSTDAIWAQLSRAPSAHDVHHMTVDPARALAPPIDRHAVEIRLLQHEVKTNLDTICTCVDANTKSIDEAKREMIGARALFEKEHERIVGEVVDLTDRSQSMIIKAVKEQTSSIPEIKIQQEQTMQKLDALDRKVDSLQMTNQAHTTALQRLQDQHASLLSNLAPILPLLQALPAHIDNSRLELKDVLRERSSETSLSAVEIAHVVRDTTNELLDPVRSEIADLYRKCSALLDSVRLPVVSVASVNARPEFSGLPPSSAPFDSSPPRRSSDSHEPLAKSRRIDPLAVSQHSPSVATAAPTLRPKSSGSSSEPFQQHQQHQRQSSNVILKFSSSNPGAPDSIVPPSTEREIELSPPPRFRLRAGSPPGFVSSHVIQPQFSRKPTPIRSSPASAVRSAAAQSLRTPRTHTRPSSIVPETSSERRNPKGPDSSLSIHITKHELNMPAATPFRVPSRASSPSPSGPKAQVSDIAPQEYLQSPTKPALTLSPMVTADPRPPLFVTLEPLPSSAPSSAEMNSSERRLMTIKERRALAPPGVGPRRRAWTIGSSDDEEEYQDQLEESGEGRASERGGHNEGGGEVPWFET